MSTTSQKKQKSDVVKSSDSDNTNEDDLNIDNEFEIEGAEVENVSEEQLKKRKKDFDEEAMPHMNLLRNYAHKITGNQLDADDLLQETYLRAFRFFDKFEKG